MAIFKSVAICSSAVVVCGLLSFSCAPSEAEHVETPDFEETIAWVGESANGLRVVAEPVFRHLMSQKNNYDEDRMLREQFALASDTRFVRVHLVGNGADLTGPGILGGADSPFVQLQKPEQLSARGQNLWSALVEGGPMPAADIVSRRSFLLKASADYDQQLLSWELGDNKLELERKSWRGRERQQFLTAEKAPNQNE